MGFEQCHPAVNLIFFTAVLAGTVCFRHPVFLTTDMLSRLPQSWKDSRSMQDTLAVMVIWAAVLLKSSAKLYRSRLPVFVMKLAALNDTVLPWVPERQRKIPGLPFSPPLGMTFRYQTCDYCGLPRG